jgi:hypothetical protein
VRILRDLAAGLNRIDEVGVVIHMENERAVRAGPEPVRIDADRLSELYRWYADDAIRLAYLITGDRSLAEDLVQDAFVRLAGRVVHVRGSSQSSPEPTGQDR